MLLQRFHCLPNAGRHLEGCSMECCKDGESRNMMDPTHLMFNPRTRWPRNEGYHESPMGIVDSRLTLRDAGPRAPSTRSSLDAVPTRFLLYCSKRPVLMVAAVATARLLLSYTGRV